MRQIEFRGKLLNTNVWIYGNLRIHFVDGDFEQENSKYFIEYNYIDKLGKVHRDSYEVDASTIGQFTGLVDKNGIKIYEGDIIKGKEWERGISHRHIGIVEYINSSFRSVGINKYLGFHGSVDGSYEVIGNIFDRRTKK